MSNARMQDRTTITLGKDTMALIVSTAGGKRHITREKRSSSACTFDGNAQSGFARRINQCSRPLVLKSS